jgi:hypothetical protein
LFDSLAESPADSVFAGSSLVIGPVAPDVPVSDASPLDGAELELGAGAGAEATPLGLTGPFIAAVKDVTVVVVVVVVRLITFKPSELTPPFPVPGLFVFP